MFSHQKFFLARRAISFTCNLRKKHVFNSPELSLSQLETYLKSYARYEDGILVLNKPSGVSFDRGLLNSDSLNPGSDVCLKNALPAIKEFFKIKELFNIKIPERQVSGVAVLTDDSSLGDEVRKWSRVMRERREPSDVYHAVVVGHPQPSSGIFDGTISLQTHNSIKRVVLSKEKEGRKGSREKKRVSVMYRTLASSRSSESSLVEVRTTRAKWNCVRVYLASQLLTPVLGDYLYSTYVKRILGAPVPVDIFTQSLLTKQKLPNGLSEELGLVGRRDLVVPLHLHLSKTRVMMGKNRVLELSMPFPQQFTWTLHRLGLSSHAPLTDADLSAAAASSC